jgi:ubiquinone/menaquinone biosynthesis C-methylase UbiE
MRRFGFCCISCVVLSFGVGVACRAPGDRAGRPDINAPFQDTNVDKWRDRFEVESREVYHHRADVVDAMGLRAGMDVADVGAGTGFFTLLFARAVAPGGTTYAVEINTGFLDMIRERSVEERITNIDTVLCTQDSTMLPPDSIDVAFICDTYHHFEHPDRTMRSIHQALRPGGRVIVIDFKHDYEDMPDERRAWVADHVRGDRATTVREIESYGFRLIDAPDPPYLTENYLIRFEKIGTGG